MAEATAEEIDEFGNTVTATAKAIEASARKHRERASKRSGLERELDLEIAAIEDDTAADLERNEQTLHSLADLERRADGE